MVLNPRFAVGISMLPPLFPVSAAIFGCDFRFFELLVVENPRFAFEVLMISVYFSRSEYFPFGWPCCYFRLSVNVAFICAYLFEFSVVENSAFVATLILWRHSAV